MENETKKQWEELMLEMDLKGQSGAIWTDEKIGRNAEEKVKQYSIIEDDANVLISDPVFYNGKILEESCPIIIR